MSVIDDLVAWVTAPQRKLSHVMAATVIAMFSFIAVNDILGFAYYYRVNRKVERFTKLTTIITDKGTDSIGRVEALALRHAVVCKKPFYLDLLNFFQKFCVSISTNKRPTVPITTATTNMAANGSMRNEFLFFVASSGVFALLGICFIPILLLSKQQAVTQRIANTIIVTVLFGFISFAMYALTNLIPRLFANWAYNYILNVLFQVLSMIFLAVTARQHRHLLP